MGNGDKGLLHYAFRIPPERLKDFKGVSAEEKLRWLEEAREFVAKFVPPDKLALWRSISRDTPNDVRHWLDGRY